MFFFFFKQKTAYEMRISDWSSDVCSSDLIGAIVGGVEGARPVVARQADAAEGRGGGGTVGRAVPVDDAGARIGPELVVELGRPADQRGGEEIGRAHV